MSDNLSDTKASRFMRKVGSGAKLMSQSLPKQSRFFKRQSRGGTNGVTRRIKKDIDQHDDVLASLNAKREFNSSPNNLVENNLSFSNQLVGEV